nr:MAG TPA: hypothetical protein [Caudoviricetes sp.]
MLTIVLTISSIFAQLRVIIGHPTGFYKMRIVKQI